MKLIIMAISIIGMSLAAMAQEGVKRTVLSTMDFPAGHQVVKVLAEIAKGACNARHSHPGIETAYVLDGEITITYDGKSPKTYKTGDAMEFDEPGAVHHACATGDRSAKTLSVYVIEKGKPFVTPAN
jgi:quercetin dioxygenase-like cupin family protein